MKIENVLAFIHNVVRVKSVERLVLDCTFEHPPTFEIPERPVLKSQLATPLVDDLRLVNSGKFLRSGSFPDLVDRPKGIFHGHDTVVDFLPDQTC